MRGEIKIGNGLKIRRVAQISDNAKAKDDLRQIKNAIKEGKLDFIWSLKTYDILEETNENGIHRTRDRSMTISEIDKQIAENRKSKEESVAFALDQINLFSQYLKAKIEGSSGGLTAELFLKMAPGSEVQKLAKLILDEAALRKDTFKPGMFNPFSRREETFADSVGIRVQNAAQQREEEMLN